LKYRVDIASTRKGNFIHILASGHGISIFRKSESLPERYGLHTKCF
jgi:hypothetical protein